VTALSSVTTSQTTMRYTTMRDSTRMLGHASAAMTLDVYADLFDDDLDSVATVLNVGALAAIST
jgi:integrase